MGFIGCSDMCQLECKAQTSRQPSRSVGEAAPKVKSPWLSKEKDFIRTLRQGWLAAQGLVPERVAGRKLADARRNDMRTPGATPLPTPGATPMGSPRSQAPLSPFTR